MLLLLMLELCEKASSYSAGVAALPTLPKSCVDVKEHFPASFCAVAGSKVFCCSACCIAVVMFLMRCGHGLIVMFS